MEAPKRKVTAKVSQSIHGHGASSSSTPSTLPSPQLTVRAQISSTARARTASNIPSPNTSNGNTNSNVNGALRPHVGATARRSPSPAKMRPGSPSKLLSHLKPSTSRAPLVKSATIIMPHGDRTRQGSLSSVLSLTPGDPLSSAVSAPTTPLPRRDAKDMLNDDSTCPMNLDSGSGSIRIKSKVSGIAKQAPPSLSTILSPPSPSSPSLTSAFSNTNRPPRARATTIASRHPSASFSVPQFHSSHSAAPHLSHELVPLPTSPPASTISYSSHSSVSASSVHPHSTNTGLSPPVSFASHARSESSSKSTFSLQATRDTSSSHDEHPPSPPPIRTLVARVRPGTRISGGSGQGQTSGFSVSGERDLGSSSAAPTAETDDRSTDDSDRSDNEIRKRRPRPTGEDAPEDDLRAEAKSNRKIADLEITTRSLLTINAALEASKLRQAREIRELRRKLRETRLIMPPGRFRLLSEQERADEDAKEAESDENEEDIDGNDCDESFKRVKMLMEDLLVAGRNALTARSPSSLLGIHQDLPSPSSTTRKNLGLGIDSESVTMKGTRMDQGEVLGWDVGSSLGVDSSSNVGKESGSRRWKHGVAIGSKVLSPEEAKLWVEDDVNEEELEDGNEGDGVEPERQADGAGSPAVSQDTTDSSSDIKPDTSEVLS